MKILVKKTILYYIKKYPIAETQLLIWYNEFSKHEFNNFNEVKNVYGNASVVNNNRIIFNIKGNDFRLIVSVNFLQENNPVAINSVKIMCFFIINRFNH